MPIERDTMDQTTLRTAMPGDAKAISAMLIASITDLCVRDHGGSPDKIAAWTANKSPDHIAGWIAARQTVLLVAHRGNAVAGAAAFFPDGRIVLNYVAPSHRFQGVSSALLAEMEQRLHAAGIALGRLVSTQTAERFYRARGWQPDGPPEISFGSASQPMIKALR